MPLVTFSWFSLCTLARTVSFMTYMECDWQNHILFSLDSRFRQFKSSHSVPSLPCTLNELEFKERWGKSTLTFTRSPFLSPLLTHRIGRGGQSEWTVELQVALNKRTLSGWENELAQHRTRNGCLLWLCDAWLTRKSSRTVQASSCVCVDVDVDVCGCGLTLHLPFGTYSETNSVTRLSLSWQLLTICQWTVA